MPLLARTLLVTLLVPLLLAAKPPRPHYGVITQLKNGLLQLVVSAEQSEDATRAKEGQKILETFTVPEDVTLEPAVFRTREALEQYLLHAYISALPVPVPPTTEPAVPPACDIEPTPGRRASTTDPGTVTGPPRIFILLPTSGPAFLPIAIGGTNFAEGAIPYVNSTPSVALFNFSTRNLPLIGSISVGFTIVPPAAPRGTGDVTVEYLCRRSNPFPFTVR